MILKRVKKAEVFADETNPVVLGKKFISGKLGQMSPHEIVSDGYTKQLKEAKVGLMRSCSRYTVRNFQVPRFVVLLFVVIGLASTFSFSCSRPTHADTTDSRPTHADTTDSTALKETESWLMLHLPSEADTSDTSESVKYSFEGCKLRVELHMKDSDLGLEPAGWDVVDIHSGSDKVTFGVGKFLPWEGTYLTGVVPLGQVDINSIKVVTVVAEEVHFAPIAINDHDFQMAFQYKEDDANRVAATLTYAAKLCGAKPLF